MADRNDESGRDEPTRGRSGIPRERQQLQEREWHESQHGRQGMQPGGQALGQRGAAGTPGEPGAHSQGWESERGSDFQFGHGGQGLSQGGAGYGYGAQGTGQGSERYGQGGYGSGRFGTRGQEYGQSGQQQDWQRGTQHGGQGGPSGVQGYGTGQEHRLAPGGQGLGTGGLPGGYGGMSGGYGVQQSGTGAARGQRSFRGMGPKNYTRSDERIREDVCERLTQDDDLDASEIEVKAEQGVVMLEGTVQERWMKHRAEDIAEGSSGVREVENRIKVESSAGRDRSASSTALGAGAASGSTPH